MRCLVCGAPNGACEGDVALTKPVLGEWADQPTEPEKPRQPEAASTLAPADVQVDD